MTYHKPLYEALAAYKSLNRASFHTPGHKNNCDFLGNLLEFDFTELDETDSLFEASGAIFAAEQAAARVFGAQRTLFSAGGCTLCIQAMLRVAGSAGAKVVCSRVVHKSAINTMALLNLEPVFVSQAQDLATGFLQPVAPAAVEAALRENAGVCAVYLTSPDYFGVMSDVAAISKICKAHEVLLIVDNAHGSHLAFLDKNLHPLPLGADMTADSLHKTLPALTGAALLHINNPKYAASAKSAMALFGSTSPSYPIMASLDLCCNWAHNHARAAYKNLTNKLEPIKNIMKEKGLLVPQGLTDPTRISLNVRSVGLSGGECAELFREAGVEPELYTDDFVVLIATPFNTNDDIFRLERAMKSLQSKGPGATAAGFFAGVPQLKMSLNEAILSASELVDVKSAVGRVSAGTVCQCPPGVPILLPGELISREHVDFLLNCGILCAEVIK